MKLTAPPSLVPLYARAALTSPLHQLAGGRHDTLPDSGYELAPQSIDPEHLARYAQVCGFRYADVVPPTYLHVLAFPLQVALMSRPGFPFPLVGLVHVANAITIHRPVTLGEQVAITVHAADLRPHAVGRQFDVLTEALVDGTPVWSGRSTYLRREKRPERPSGPRLERTASAGPGATARLAVPGDTGRRYAAVSGDRNPIHLSALSARLFGFPSAIAHGMWLKARTLATLEGRLADRYTVEVSFKTPVFLPSTVAVSTAADAGGWTLDVRSARSGKPHLNGTVRSG